MARTARRFAWLLAFSLAAIAPPFARAEDPPKPEEPPKEEEGPDKTKGYIGFTPGVIEALDADQRKEFGLQKDSGWYVNGVLPGAPADKAGLKKGDILIAMDGEKFPDTKHLDRKDRDAIEKFVTDTMKKRTKKPKPGDTVTVTVERDGKPVDISAVSVDWDSYQVMVEAWREEEMSVKVPDPADAGPFAAYSFDFETQPEGESKPAGFLSVLGEFEIYPDPEKAENHVLKSSPYDPFAWLAVTGTGHALKDGTARVRFQLVDGAESFSAGIVLRVKDRKNWLAVRVDGVTKDLRVIRVKDGKTERLASTDVGSPKLKAWHTLEVTFSGGKVTGVFDGDKKVEAIDEAPVLGWCGLMTAIDAESLFDDFAVAPAASK